MESPHQHRRRGAALMLSLWALFLLSAMVISWAIAIGSRMTLSGNANRSLEAEAMACSGAEVAMQPQVKPGSPALEGEFRPGQRYETRITGEGGRINLTFLIQKLLANDLVAREFLVRYLEIKGIDLNERDRMIDTLLDWVDADNLARLNGAEDEGDYKPPNRALTSIEELKKIKGWEEFTSMKDWDSDLTLYTAPTPINLAWASRDVLMALGVSEDRVDQFLTMRPGPDGINGTDDDTFIKAPEEALAVLGFTPQLFQQQLGSLAVPSAQEQVWRVISVGESNGVERTVQMIVQKSPGGPVAAVKSWKEL